MTVKDVVNELNLTVVTDTGDLERDVNGCYIGDLLSWVMSNAQTDNVWLTIMSNINIVAVATLTDVSCVILCEDVNPDDDCVEKAKVQGITILKTPLSAYEVAVRLGKLI